MADDELVVRDLVKRYGAVAALEGVSLAVGAGEIFGLLGRNGAGKTSLIECVVGLRKADSGSVALCGVNAAAYPRKIKQLVGVQLQRTAMQEKITPREALRLFGSFYARHADVGELIERFGLGEKADASFDSLSEGQRQRLGLALAMVNQPRVLFLDEPTAGVDAQGRRELHEIIRGVKARGGTVVLTTHYIEEAQSLCDRVGIIEGGRIVAMGRPGDLIAAAGGICRVDWVSEKEVQRDWALSLAGVREVGREGKGWRVRTASVERTVSELVGKLEKEGNRLVELQVRRPTLEDVVAGEGLESDGNH